MPFPGESARGRDAMRLSGVVGSLLLLYPAMLLGQTMMPLNKEQLDKRLLSVGRLIEQSSASRQIEASGDAGALGGRAQARDAYRQALQARDAGDYATAVRLVSEASTLLFAAAKLAARGKVIEERLRADFAARMQSVKSLLAAQQRISAEKPNVDAAEAGRTIEKLINEASQLSAANEQAKAEAVVNKAYLVAKAAVSSMRRGDTLVRSLDFRSREDEYRYELDRNDAHLILIKVLASEMPTLTRMDGMPKAVVDKAAELRGQAERAAGGGDYAGAIGLLEGSTRELVRAIRSLGVFIPG